MDSETYEFRKFQISDFADINSLYFEEYGKDYPYPLNSSREDLTHFSTVILLNKTIIGFARATPYRNHKDIFEFGGLIVARAYRKHGLAKKLTDIRLLSVLKENPRIIFSEPVCNRPDKASQLNLIHHGFIYLGIRPFKYPAIKQKILGKQGESVALAAQYYQADDFGTRPIYITDDYIPFLQALPNLCQKCSEAKPMQTAFPGIQSRQGMVSDNLEGSSFVHIPLNWMDARVIINNFRNQGYLFSGILPGYGKTESGEIFDYITLYKPPRIQLYDFGLIHVIPEMEDLKKLMEQEYLSSFSNFYTKQASSQRRLAVAY